MQQLSYLGFGILGLTSTIHGMALPFLIEEYSLTLSVAGLLLFANSFGYLLASVAFPFLQKRRPSARILSVAFLIIAVTYTLFPLSPWWALAVALGFLASLGTGTIDVGFNTLISSLDPEKAQPALNWLHFSYGIGALVGPIFLSRFAYFGLSWSAFYFSTSILATLFVLLWRNYLGTTVNNKSSTAPRANTLKLYKQAPYWMLLVSIFIYVAVEVALVGWVPTLLTSLGVRAVNASLGISVLWLGIALGRALCTQAVKKMSSRVLLLFLTSSTALAMLVLIFIQPLWLVFTMLFTIGLFLSAIFPLILFHSSSLFPMYVAESTSGLVVAGSFGAMVGPAFLGLIGQHYSLHTGVAILAGVMLLSTLILALVPQELNQSLELAPSNKTGAKVTD